MDKDTTALVLDAARKLNGALYSLKKAGMTELADEVAKTLNKVDRLTNN